MDRFATPVKLNVNGSTEISSWPGSILSILLFLLLAAYTYQRFMKLILRENPDIQIATISNFYDKDYTVNLSEIGFKLAFGVNDYKDGKPYDDPNYVKWTVRLNDYENQRSVNKQNIKFHKCTEADYDSFYPPGPNDVEAVKAIREGGYSLYCFDDN